MKHPKNQDVNLGDEVANKIDLRKSVNYISLMADILEILLVRCTHLTSACHRIKFTNRHGITYLALRCSFIFLNIKARIIAVTAESVRSAS
jgi:hypothetical protein